jgi:heat shock protein HtpX
VSMRAVLLVVMVAALFTAIGSLFGLVGAAVALTAAIFIVFWSFWSAAGDILAQLNAVPCSDPGIIHATSIMAASAGIPAPLIYEIEDAQPNAFALGPNPQSAIVILTSALSAQLTRPEINAVIAHELAHIHNRDTLTSAIATTFVSAIASLALLLGLIGLIVCRHGGAVIIALAAVAPLIALILRFALSRSVEYSADRDAVHLCNGPRNLISALQKLEQSSHGVESKIAALEPALASLYIVDPMPGSWLSRIFCTHPPTARRIARLEAMCLRSDGR